MHHAEFARALVDTEDLDPVYCVLARGGMKRPALLRWLLAYWCFYHAGVASILSELKGAAYWSRMVLMDRERAPRGSERRHFRGANSARAIAELEARYPVPEYAAYYMACCEYSPTSRIPLVQIIRRVQEHHAFGPWIAWKVADMAERVLKVQVDFEGPGRLAMYLSPMQGAADVNAELGVYEANDPLCASKAVKAVLSALGMRMAPPYRDRRCGVQEAETVLCKFHSHLSGHYEVGKDWRELRHALEWARNCGTARALLKHVREVKTDGEGEGSGGAREGRRGSVGRRTAEAG